MTQATGVDCLPDGIGPHEGIEFNLMRSGQKNIAMFSEVEPEGLDDILEEGYCLLQFPQFTHGQKIYFTWIVFREGYDSDAIRLKCLIQGTPHQISSAREHGDRTPPVLLSKPGREVYFSRKILDIKGLKLPFGVRRANVR